MHPMLSEFIGTALLVLFGNGVVANVCLKKTKGSDSGWIVIAAGWGIAVYIGAFCSDAFSGAHLNPAVSIAMLVGGKLSPNDTIIYIIGQFGGAMLGAVLVYLFYRDHFHATDDGDAKLGCFCTASAIRDNKQAFFCEAVGTFALIFPIFLMVTPSLISEHAPIDPAPVLGLGSLGLLPVGLLVFGIGLSLGGTTGYAINPARDLGPRIVHALIPMRSKRDSDWSYSWVPVAGPVVGAVCAAVLYRMIG
ncbi:MIP/aquaporin family protein [Allorhodopirellula heiligendammensis]|uniref:Glycerol uptake facilitator protein n=1 Tax=Allorhodopirellula heiligendammensis TaxID=2714739 RepID=A0A5C6C5F2_9BACT|nr:MIP/aquaporin family protein [Allorhodopirellula heiligendammensis]TWU18781.1 putative glycerol uptake facilitator protein [Allorhodopirellula heiligendammensis]